MMENVALDKKNQKAFKSSVDNYKKLLKEGKIKIKKKVVSRKSLRKLKAPRGIVYLSNIPHGFYEKEMEEFFCQFGKVTRLRLARSLKTGKSKGFAFIQFKEPDVAKIVAETMDQYLMHKRLLKAKYIAPEEQKKNYFLGENYSPTFYPALINRKKAVKKNRESISKAVEESRNKKMLRGIAKTKRKLQEIGIDYNFQPVNIPEGLKHIESKDVQSTDSTESDDNVPVLEIDESDDGIIFQTPPGVKKIIKKSVAHEQSTSPKTNFVRLNKVKKDASKSISKKLSGISKKQKGMKVPIEKESKKMKLIQKNILNMDQINLKSVKDMKQKKIVGNKPKNSLKSPKNKKSMK